MRAGTPTALNTMSVLRPEEPPPPWRGAPPQEYRGTDIVARFTGPLMTLGDPLVREGCAFGVCVWEGGVVWGGRWLLVHVSLP